MASRSDYVWLTAIVVLLTVVHFLAGNLPCVGDETRYAFQGVGLYSNGSFYPQPGVWKAFADASGCGNGGVLASDHPGRPLQTISTSLIYGAVLRAAGLEGARWLNFIVGCVGIVLLYFLLKARFATWPARITLAAIALSLPFVPYLQLIYPETLLFTTVAAALYALLRHNRYAAVATIVALPFLHERALPLGLAFFVLLVMQMARDRAPAALFTRICALYIAGIAVFAASQLWLYGSLFGSAFPAYSPSIANAFDRIGMQLYDVRHGAVAYTPLLIVAFAGLLLGTLRRDRFCAAALALFAIYFATFMWSTAQESWTGRFWVAGLPFLAIGLCYWLRDAKQWWEWLPAAPLLAVSIANAVTYVANPLWFLESRAASIPYAALFLTTHIHLGLFLPVDADPGGIAPYTQPIASLLTFTAIAVALLVWCRILQTLRSRAFVCALAGATLIAPFVLALSWSVDRRDFTTVVFAKRGEFVISLHSRHRIDAIQFDDQIPAIWTAPPYPSLFSLRCLRNGTPIASIVEPAHPLLMVPHCSDIDTIDIVAKPLGRAARSYHHMLGPIRLITRAL